MEDLFVFLRTIWKCKKL